VDVLGVEPEGPAVAGLGIAIVAAQALEIGQMGL
jgi:hypothetical protein